MNDWYRAGDALLRDIAGAAPAPGEVCAWFLGQVGYVFRSRQTTVMIDPFLNDLTDDSGASLRLFAPPFPMDGLCPDYVLCTHGHEDHMALPTLRAIARAGERTRFLVPGACVQALLDEGIPAGRIQPLAAKTPLSLPGLTVLPVQAAHPVHMKDELGRDTALCLCLEMDGVRMTHLGDTYLTGQLLNDLTALPSPDVLFAPINGGDYFRTAQQITHTAADKIRRIPRIEQMRLHTLYVFRNFPHEIRPLLCKFKDCTCLFGIL